MRRSNLLERKSRRWSVRSTRLDWLRVKRKLSFNRLELLRQAVLACELILSSDRMPSLSGAVNTEAESLAFVIKYRLPSFS